MQACSKNVFGLLDNMRRTKRFLVFLSVACCLLAGLQTTHQAEMCVAGQYLVEASEPNTTATCVSCPEHTDSVEDSAGLGSCVCDPGYTGTSTANTGCVGCPIGTYKYAAGTAPCLECGDHSSSTVGSAVCECFTNFSGVFFDTSALCTGTSASAPWCEAVFEMPPLIDLTSVSMTIDVWQSDFSSVSEFIEITAGPVVLGSFFLQGDGDDNFCNVKTVINNRLLPTTAFVEADGQRSLRVRMSTTGTVGGFVCFGKTLYAKIDVGMRCIPQCPEHGTAPPATISRDACVCNAGYYGFECTACPGSSTGTVGAMSRQDCTCNAGYFGTECVACAPGSYTPEPNNAAECSSCAVGTYTDSIAQAQCQPCPAKQTTVHIGAGTVDTCVCESGTYITAGDSDSGGGGVCVGCPAGTYYTLLGANHLADKNNVCIACERGTYSNTVGAASRHDCRPCAPGTFMPTEGSSSAASCQLCAAGTYSSGVLELLGPGLIAAWTDAGINQWILGKHGENCLQTCRAADMRCVGAEGFPQLLSQQTTRVLFAQDDMQCRGSVENSTNATAPCMSENHACVRGVGTSTCSASAVGQARMCPCADNMFLALDDDLGSARLVDWAKDGLRLWTLANPKQNCHATCSGESLVCTSRGNFVAKTLSNSDLSAVFAKLGVDCRQFLPGYSTGMPAAVRSSSSYGWLYSCKTHNFNPNTYQCEAASIQSNEYQLCFCSESHDTVFPTIFRLSNETHVGATTCSDCVAGKYSASSGQPACDLCARGKYSGIVGATDQEVCAVCVPGTHTLEAGRTAETECVACVIGTHKSADGMLVCDPCELGKFSAREALPDCTPCSADTYANTTGKTSCVACSPGKFVSLTGSVMSDACVSCLPGTYLGMPLNTTTQRCLVCPPGTYSDTPGMRTCTACQAGAYQVNPGAIASSACISCEPGKFSGSIRDRIAESSTREWRAQGIEQWLLGSNGESCVAVCDAAGLMCNNGDGQPWPQQLPWTHMNGLLQLHNTSCLLLGGDPANGTTAPFVAHGVNCYTGSGDSTCEAASQQHARLCPCSAAAGSDAALLLNAQHGFWTHLEQQYVGASGCLDCGAGTYLGTAGNVEKHSCTPCGRGSFSLNVGAVASSTCETCPAGTFAGNLGTSVCSMCPMGTFSAEASMSVCTDCHAGSYSGATGAVTADLCVLCVVGKYSGQSGSTAQSDCLQCRAGTYSDTPGSSVCLLCSPGTFLAIEGSDASTSDKQCSECAAGKYSGTLVDHIEVAQLHEWAKSGIERWIVGRAGESCDAVCHEIGLGCNNGPANHEATNPLWQGSVQFPQDLVQTTTDVLFLQNDTNCEYNTDSEHPSAPFVSNHTHCHRGVGVSSCSASAPTHSRLCPCSTFPLINLVGIMDIATAWRWARLGVRSWKLARDGDSCSVSCGRQDQLCTAGSNRAQFLTKSDQDDLYGHLGINCGGQITYELDNIVAPLVNSDGQCRSAVSASRGRCIQPAHGRRRVCACGVASFDSEKVLQIQNPEYPGASTCLDCVPGTFLPTTGNIHRIACELCGKGTFSAVTGLGAAACQWCRAGTFSSLLGQTSMQTCTACVAGKYAETHGNTAESNCTECPAGTYSGAVEAVSAETCVPCGVGTYHAGSGAITVSVCTACGAGKYSAQIGAVSESVCVSCAAGTWSMGSGMSSADDCILCAVGTFSSAFGASSVDTCALCGPGKYMTSEGANAETQCELCGSGTYLPSSGSTSAATCIECGEGKYGLIAGGALESTCELCVSGKISNVTGAQSEATCTECALGKYRVNPPSGGSTYPACVECAMGTFADDTGSSVCTQCAAGSVSTDVGATSPDTCVLCALGKYVSSPGRAVCILCAIGSFAALEGLTTCTLCAPGKYSTALEAGTEQENLCVQCPIATYSELHGQTSSTTCSQCPPGTYSEHGGLARRFQCLDCLGGTYSDTPGATMCATCGVGTYSAEEIVTYNVEFPFGAQEAFPVSSLDYLPSCTPCFEQSFADTTTVADVSACVATAGPGGYIGMGAKSSVNADYLGPMGFIPAVNFWRPPGALDIYRMEFHHDAVEENQANGLLVYWVDDENGLSSSSVRVQLYGYPLGPRAVIGFAKTILNLEWDDPYIQLRPIDVSSWRGCQHRLSFMLERDQQDAYAGGRAGCIENIGLDTVWQKVMYACRPVWKTSGNITSCSPCAAGTYSDVQGTNASSNCQSCPPGTYSSTIQATSVGTCQECPIGTYSSAFGASSEAACQGCLAGKYSPNTGTAAENMCLPCAAGTYSSAIAATTANTCTPCLAGKYLNTMGNTNADDCILCAQGTYSSQARASACENCVSGTYSTSTGNAHVDTCGQCVAGTFADTAASTVCTECAAGKISTVVGAPSPDTCIQCASGKYVSSPGSVACILCPIGSYAALQGLEICTLCASGKYSTALETGAVHGELCVQCPTRTTPNAQHTNCTCSAGSTGLDGGICTYCVPGKYKNTTGANECTDCKVGQFSASVGAVSDVCQACVANASAPAGSGHRTACTCNAGSSGPDGGNCTQCLAGTYKTAAAADPNVCSECMTGKYSPTVGAASSSVCQQCPAASDAPSASVNEQQCKCNMGWTHNAPLSDPAKGGVEAYCQACKRATYTSMPGSQRCTDCTPAQYLNPLYAPTNGTTRRMCTVQTFALHQAVNTNVRFQLQRESPCTVRFLLNSATNWTTGDRVRINYPGKHHPTPNPPVLRYMATKQSNMGPVLQWSPINIEPMHVSNTTYTITLEKWPLLLTLDAYSHA